jgi:hypothetical protein
MSIATVIAAASALKTVNDQIENLQRQKDDFQLKVQEINADLVIRRADRDTKIAALKAEADTI